MSDTGYQLVVRWPILDDSHTLTQIHVEALGQIDTIAAAAGATITGTIHWALDDDGTTLTAQAPARPRPTATGRARHGLAAGQADRIRDLAGRRLTDRQIAAIIGCGASAISHVRRRNGIPPGVGNPTLANAA